MMKGKNLFLKELVQGFLFSREAGKKYLVYNLLLSVLTAVLPIVSFWFIKRIIDIVAGAGDASRKEFVYALIMLLLVQVIQAVLQQLMKDLQALQQQVITDHLSGKVMEKAVSVDYPYYEDAAYFNSLHMAQQEVAYRTGILTNSYNLVIQHGIAMLVLMILFLQLSWFYALVVIVAAVPVLIIKWKHALASQELEKENLLNERKAVYLSRVLTDAAHAREVRTFGFGKPFIEKFREIRYRIFTGKKRLSSKQGRAETMIQVVEIIVTGAVVFRLGFATFNGLLTIGSFIFYLQALQRLQSGLNNFLAAFTQLFRQRYFVKNILDFLQLPLQREAPAGATPFPDDIQQGIAVKGVSFSYPGSSDRVLENIDMQFKPGSITAIIGENGSGKSTLVKLLARLYEVQHGTIMIGSRHIDAIASDQYYDNLSFLFQEYNQYHFSVAENISLGKATDHNKLSAVAATAGLTGLVQKQPKGFDTNLGKMFGADLQLSGGQWQKVAIARMLYRDTPVMVLDEPTSNIDPLAEYEILERLRMLKENKIIILITHKMHNLKFADHIYVMDDGRVNGAGTMEELLQHNELFKKMYRRQEPESR